MSWLAWSSLTVIAVLHVATQQYKINFFSKFVDALQIRRILTKPGIGTSFLPGTKLPGSAMGSIRQLFNGNKGSFHRVNWPGSKGENPLPDTADVKRVSTCQYLLTSICLIQHSYNKKYCSNLYSTWRCQLFWNTLDRNISIYRLIFIVSLHGVT